MFTALLLLLVLGMGITVLLHARRSLRFEPYRRRFLVVGSLTIAASALLVVAQDLAVLALAWLATSRLAVALIETGPSGGIDRALRARRAFLVGDVALVAAVATLALSAGSTSMAQLDDVSGLALAVAGVLLVVAAAARCASGPFVRWLPDSLAAPTPSSALLHAGVVNGGAIVLIKLAPATAGTLVAAALAVVIGGATATVARAVGPTRADVKGQLAWSTVAQMGFTLALCGLGLHVAAGLHLVAHGAFKGTRFLGAGSGVRQVVRARRAPVARRTRPAVGFAIATGAAAAALALTGVEVHADLAVAGGLGWFAAGCAITAGLRMFPTRLGRATVGAAGALGLAGYLVATIALEQAVAGDLGVASPALSAWLVVPVLVAMCAAGLVERSARVPTWACDLGRPVAPARVPPQRAPADQRPTPGRRPPSGPRPRPSLAPTGA